MQTLQQFESGQMTVPKQDEPRLVKQVLSLVHGCLSFDFMGTIPDETSEEQGTVMVPHSWNILRDDGISQLFFSLYGSCVASGQAPAAVLALQCLVLLAALRRSFFQKDEDRMQLLGSMMVGTTKIISQKIGLTSYD